MHTTSLLFKFHLGVVSMPVSRRRFLGGATAAGAAAAASITGTSALPPIEIVALNRMGYGPRPGDVAAFQALGATPDAQLAAYVDQQLNPDTIDDSGCDTRVA